MSYKYIVTCWMDNAGQGLKAFETEKDARQAVAAIIRQQRVTTPGLYFTKTVDNGSIMFEDGYDYTVINLLKLDGSWQ